MSIPVSNNNYFLNLPDKSKKVIKEEFNSTNNFYKTNEYNFMLRITLAAYMDPFSAKSIMDVMNSPGVRIKFIKVFLRLNSNTIYRAKTPDGVIEFPHHSYHLLELLSFSHLLPVHFLPYLYSHISLEFHLLQN